MRPPRLFGIKIFAKVNPYGLAKKNIKRTLKLFIIPPAAFVAYVFLYAAVYHCVSNWISPWQKID